MEWKMAHIIIIYKIIWVIILQFIVIELLLDINEYICLKCWKLKLKLNWISKMSQQRWLNEWYCKCIFRISEHWSKIKLFSFVTYYHNKEQIVCTNFWDKVIYDT